MKRQGPSNEVMKNHPEDYTSVGRGGFGGLRVVQSLQNSRKQQQLPSGIYPQSLVETDGRRCPSPLVQLIQGWPKPRLHCLALDGQTKFGVGWKEVGVGCWEGDNASQPTHRVRSQFAGCAERNRGKELEK